VQVTTRSNADYMIAMSTMHCRHVVTSLLHTETNTCRSVAAKRMEDATASNKSQQSRGFMSRLSGVRLWCLVSSVVKSLGCACKPSQLATCAAQVQSWVQVVWLGLAGFDGHAEIKFSGSYGGFVCVWMVPCGRLSMTHVVGFQVHLNTARLSFL